MKMKKVMMNKTVERVRKRIERGAPIKPVIMRRHPKDVAHPAPIR